MVNSADSRTDTTGCATVPPEPFARPCRCLARIIPLEREASHWLLLTHPREQRSEKTSMIFFHHLSGQVLQLATFDTHKYFVNLVKSSFSPIFFFLIFWSVVKSSSFGWSTPKELSALSRQAFHVQLLDVWHETKQGLAMNVESKKRRVAPPKNVRRCFAMITSPKMEDS